MRFPRDSIPEASCGSLSAAHDRNLDLSEYIQRYIKPCWCSIYHSCQAHCRHPKVAGKVGAEETANYTSQTLADLMVKKINLHV